MKILFVQHRDFINGSGGTEKICSFLANGFSGLGYTVEIATHQNIDGKPVFPLHKEIVVTNIFSKNTSQIELKKTFNYRGINPLEWMYYKFQKKKLKRKNKRLLNQIGGADELFRHNLRHRAKAWKSYIDSVQPDIIVTMTISSLLEITFENEYQIPIVNSTNGRPDYDYSDILWYRSPFEMNLLKDAYRKLSGIQILFDSYRNFLPDTFEGRCITIPNPVPQIEEDTIVNHFKKKEKYKMINMGSLAIDCKQQHLAIDAFASLSEKFPDWELHFWGIGTDYNFLNDKIQQLNLQHRIFLNGFTDDPMSKLKDADLFIFPSKYEGFGLALAEAMSSGLPCIGFKTCSGVNELIKHNQNGFLAEDVEELKIYFEKLMSDSELRNRLGKNAHLTMGKYDKTNVFQQWKTFVETFI